MNKLKDNLLNLSVLLIYFLITIVFFYEKMSIVSLEMFKTPLIYVALNTLSNLLSMIVNIVVLNLFIKLGYKLVKKKNLSDSLSITFKLVFSLQIFHVILQFYGLENIQLNVIAILILFNPIIHIINYRMWYKRECCHIIEILKVSIPYFIYLILDFISIYMLVR